jgi:hypothetical protein
MTARIVRIITPKKEVWARISHIPPENSPRTGLGVDFTARLVGARAITVSIIISFTPIAAKGLAIYISDKIAYKTVVF